MGLGQSFQAPISSDYFTEQQLCEAANSSPFFDHLPRDLFLDILVNWIGDARSLAQLDSACTATRLRRLLHEQYSQIILPEEAVFLGPKWRLAKKWFETRGVGLRRAMFDLRPLWGEPLRCQHLQHLSLVIIDRSIQGDEFYRQLKACPSLEILELSYPFYLPLRKLLRSINHWSLRSLTIRDVGDIHADERNQLIHDLLSLYLPDKERGYKGLESLVIDQFHDLCLSSIDLLPQFSLRKLDLSINDISFSVLQLVSLLSQLSTLQELSLELFPMNGEDPISLADGFVTLSTQLPELRIFQIAGLPETVTYPLISATLLRRPTLEFLRVNRFSLHCGDSALEVTLSSRDIAAFLNLSLPCPLTKLKVLAYSSLDQLLPPLLASHGATLVDFSLESGHLDDSCVDALVKHCPQVRKLRLSALSTSSLSITALCRLSDTYQQQLSCLSMTRCKEAVYDDSLYYLSTQCSKIERIDLRHCFVSPDGVHSVLKNCPALRAMRLEHTEVQLLDLVQGIVQGRRLYRPLEIAVDKVVPKDESGGILSVPWWLKLGWRSGREGCHHMEDFFVALEQHMEEKRANPWRGRQANGRPWLRIIARHSM